MKTNAFSSAVLCRRGLTMALLMGLMAALAACYPGTVDNITELDLVVTNYDEGFDFQSVRFYAMPNQVIDIAETIDQDRLVYWDQSDLSSALSTIESQMTARGYERVDLGDCSSLECVPDNVEFFIMVGATTSTTVAVGGGWGCYPYWGYGGCWGYPWCCSYAYSYESGTLVTNFVKPTEVTDPDAELQVHWNLAVQGVLSSSGQTDNQRLDDGIAQGFAQSPYLKAAAPAPSMTMVKGEASMKRVILCCLLAVTLLFAGTQDAAAQSGVSYKGDNLWMVTYAVGFPLSETKDYIDNISWLGFYHRGSPVHDLQSHLGDQLWLADLQPEGLQQHRAGFHDPDRDAVPLREHFSGHGDRALLLRFAGRGQVLSRDGLRHLLDRTPDRSGPLCRDGEQLASRGGP